MRSDHLSKHVKRHPGYQPGMMKKFRRDKPQGLVSILLPSNIKENDDDDSEVQEEQRKHLKSIIPSRVCVTRADSMADGKTEERSKGAASKKDRVATVYDGLME